MALPHNYSFGALLSHLPILSRGALFVVSYYERKYFHKAKTKTKGRRKIQSFLGYKLSMHHVQPMKSQNAVHTTFLQLHHEDTANQLQVFLVLENLNTRKLYFVYQGRCCTSTTKYVCVHLFLKHVNI